VGDALLCASATSGARDVAKNKYFGDKNIESVARSLGFNASEVRLITWHGKRGVRKIAPVSVMILVLEKIKNAHAEKLLPDFKTVVDKITDGAIVVHTPVVQTPPDTAVDQLGAPSGIVSILTPDQPILTIPPVDQTLLSTNPYNSSTQNTLNLIERAKAQLELTTVAAETLKLQNDFVNSANIEKATTDATKRKIELVTEREEWTCKLLKLNDKFEWAETHGRTELMAAIEEQIKDT